MNSGPSQGFQLDSGRSLLSFNFISNRVTLDEAVFGHISIDSQDTLAFSVLAGVRSMNEEFPLERVNEAYERMSSKARFRAVLTMTS